MQIPIENVNTNYPSKDEQEKFISKMIDDEQFRRDATSKSLFWFMRCYLPRHVWLGTADFQKEILAILEKDILGITAITAFRDAGKSSLLRAYIIQQIVTGKKKFILIGSKTERQAQDHLKSIKREFEDQNNILLQKDLGPFMENSDEWGKSIVVSNYDARIVPVSVEQGIRGIHYRQYRPDLVVLDDIEDLASIRSKEATDKIHEWLERDVIPAGAQNARFIIISNLLSEDSVMTRLRKDIEKGARDGIFRRYPLIDESGKVAWPEKFPTTESLEQEKRKHTDLAWKQEFLLLPITNADPVIREEWLKFYRELPEINSGLKHKFRLISVDPAISEKAHANCTAIVCAEVYENKEGIKIFIEPNPINKRGLSAKETVDLTKLLYDQATSIGHHAEVVVETVGMQSIYTEMMRTAGIVYVNEFSPGRQDKRERLNLAGYHVQNGKVFFHESEANGDLIRQIVQFGSASDDLADAFSMAIIEITEKTKSGIYFSFGDSVFDSKKDYKIDDTSKPGVVFDKQRQKIEEEKMEKLVEQQQAQLLREDAYRRMADY